MIIIKLIYAILLIGAGASIIKYRRIVKSWTGNFLWAEKYIGRGSTYLVIIVLGIGLIVYGIRYPFIQTQNSEYSSVSQQ